MIFLLNMSVYQKIIPYGLIVAGSFGLLGCEQLLSEPNYVYVSGKVQNEKYQKNFFDNDQYSFSFNTEHGLKTFTCYGDTQASNLDLLINPSDEVKIELSCPPHSIAKKWIEKNTQFSGYCSNVVELNGQPL